MKNLLALAVILMAFACSPAPEQEQGQQPAGQQLSNEQMIAKGRHLVTIGLCNDCHSPKLPDGEPDPGRLLSGHPQDEILPSVDTAELGSWVLFSQGFTAAVGPWGVSYAANLTPDDTGIGFWTEAQFMKAIREGKYKGLDGSRPLLPPMPWPMFAEMSDEELKAVFAYLKSLKPVRNVVPAPVMLAELK